MQEKNPFFGNFTGTKSGSPNTPVSEDCLYLNIHAPETNKEVSFKPETFLNVTHSLTNFPIIFNLFL